MQIIVQDSIAKGPYHLQLKRPFVATQQSTCCFSQEMLRYLRKGMSLVVHKCIMYSFSQPSSHSF